MSIDFKKLKSQIKREMRDGKQGWFFQPTKEQIDAYDASPIFFERWSKRRVIDYIVEFEGFMFKI